MARTARTLAVPKGWEAYFGRLVALSDAFCRQHLNEEYAELARRALAALCRKRSRPLASGRPETWVCAVLYALGQINFLHDRATEPYLSMQDLCGLCGVAPSTGGNKAKQVRDLLGLHHFDHRWMLPSRIETTAAAWMVEVDGLVGDIRDMPLLVQEAAVEKGLIPYVPAYRAPAPPGASSREEILSRYRSYRSICDEHQAAAGKRLPPMTVPEIAGRWGLLDTDGARPVIHLDHLMPALDFALYAPSGDGTTPIARHAAGRIAQASGEEREVLEALGHPRFAVLEMAGRHPQAGWMAQDLAGGDPIWVLDIRLEQMAMTGARIAMRLIRPRDFWMSSGIGVPMTDPEHWQALMQQNSIEIRDGRLQVPAELRLDEVLYRLAFGRPA